MGIQADFGIFDCPASTGVAVVTTALDFTPKCYFLYGVPVAGETATVHTGRFLGMTDGTSEFSLIGAARNGGAGDTRRDIDQTRVLIMVDGDSDTRLVEATHSSFNSDGFSLNFSTVTVNLKIHWVAFGGTELTDVKVGSALASASPVTGLGFQPDFLLTMTGDDDLTPTANNHSDTHFGVTDGTNEWWLSAWNGRDDSASVDSVLSTATGFIGAIKFGNRNWEISLTSFDVGGFTWSGTDPAGFYYMAMKTGGAIVVDNFTKTTAAAPASQDLPDPGFQPGLYLLASGSRTDQPHSTPDGCGWAVGVSDGVAMQNALSMQRFNLRDTDKRQNNDHVLQLGKRPDLGVDAQATVSAITDNTPTITWNPNNSDADIIGVVYVDIESVAPLTGYTGWGMPSK